MSGFITVSGAATAEYCEKRSRFIAEVRHCADETEALNIINEIRTRCWDARHNVFAYSLHQNSLQRFSDDGEPHGTAGKPVLDVINGSGIQDVVVVVTRYFGGVLLGTGGLVRAYSKAAKDALEAAEKQKIIPCTKFITECDYSDQGRLVNLINEYDGDITSSDYGVLVTVKYSVPSENADVFFKALSERFSARLTAEISEK